MADYNQLKARAQQVRDEQTIGGNTALRVGQLLMDMVDAESETVDNIVELFTGTEDNPVIPTLPNPGLLHWLQSPIVALVSMGEDLDGDAGAVVQEGDLYYYNHSGYQIFVKGSGSLPGTGYKARQKVIYINKYTGRIYEWDGADMSEIVLTGVGGGGGNVTIEEGQNYIDITIIDNTPVIEVSTQSIVMSGQTKTATFTVSGHNLTAPIRINGGNAYFSKSPSSISPVGGIVEATTVTVTFGGTDDDTDDLTVSSVGATAQTVHVAYTAVAGPNIVVSPDTLSFKAATSETDTKTVSVQGSLLDADVVVSTSSPFAVSLDGTTFNSSVTIPKATAMAGATVYVRYTAGSSASTGTLTLESTGATSKTVDLTGAVSTLTVSSSSLSFSTEAGTPVTKTFTVQGANLTQDISISASGTGFSVSPATIDKDDAATAQTVTVTYSPSETGTNTGSITLQSGGASATVTLEGTASAGLPTGYTKLTYLQGITRQMQSPVVTYPQTWEFDVQCDALTSNIQILACVSSAGGKWVGASNNGKWGVGITDATCTTVQVTTRATVTATLKSTGVEITIGNETITRNADSASTGYAWLFGCNETDKRLFGGKVYGVRLVSGGTADLVLASRDSDGQQGIYNLTNNTFYGLT